VLDVAAQRPLVIAVDDIDRVDESSAAFLALLAHGLSGAPLIMLATSNENAAAPHLAASLRLLATMSTPLHVTPLALEATQQLLGSVFGEVPNLQLLAHHLQQVSGGNPRDLMQLGQHLVDKGVIRYRAGSWSLPGALDASDLPSGMAQALRARVDMLGAHARTLAQTIARAPDRPFAFEDCLALAQPADAVSVMHSLDELLAASVLRFEGECYVLARHAWASALCESLDAAALAAHDERLAELFAARGDGLRAAQHLLRAGKTDRGLDAIIEHSRVSRELTDGNPAAFIEYLRSLPEDWQATYERALALCEVQGRPRAQVYTILSRVCGILGATTTNAAAAFEALIGELSRQCGLELYGTLDPALPALQRLKIALDTAQQRHAQAPPEERVVDPLSALQQLARALVQAASSIALGFDHARLERLPSLEPLFPVSPAFGLVDSLMRGVEARISGRAERALEIYTGVLERLAQPDRSGLDASHHLYTVNGVQCGMGMLEATMGLASCLERAALIERQAQHHSNAILVRMLYHLWQGDSRAAEQLKRDAELVRIQGAQRRTFDGVHLLGEVTAYALSGDLTGVKQATEDIEELAQRFPGWIPVLHFARGEYQRLRGDAAQALAEIEAALARVEPGRHQAWPLIAAAHLRVLFELGRHADACALGERYLDLAAREDLGYVRAYLKMPLALSLANSGAHVQAAAAADAAIEDFTALGTTGLNLVVAYETRARVAIRAGDQSVFERFAARLAEHIPAGSARTLLASHERTLKEARSAGLQEGPAHAAGAEEDTALILARSVLRTCHDLAACARTGLELLVHSTASRGGVFYSVDEHGVELAAQLGELAHSPEIHALVREYAAEQLDPDQITRQEVAQSAVTLGASGMRSNWTQSNGDALRPILVGHEERGAPVVTGVVVLLPAAAFSSPTAAISEVSRALQRARREVRP
jgi:tetratricopeptide (TPR) repeat protein